jgi:hypothetical protein
LFIFWKIQINSNDNSKRKYPHKALCAVRHFLVCTDHEIHTCARSYATLGWISWKSMHFSWKDDSPLWIIHVSWCRIERAGRLHLRLGNLLHLHVIRDSKTWNDSDKTSMTAGNYKTSFIIPWWLVSVFFLWQAALLEKPWLHLKWLHFSFDPHSSFDKPKTLKYIEYISCWH